MYTYVENNPLTKTDPTGHCSCTSKSLTNPSNPLSYGAISSSYDPYSYGDPYFDIKNLIAPDLSTEQWKLDEQEMSVFQQQGQEKLNTTIIQQPLERQLPYILQISPNDKIVNALPTAYRNCNYDCSEIAEDLYNIADFGEIITFRPSEKYGQVNTMRDGYVTVYDYHTVYSDGSYVYDPRYSLGAILKTDYLEKLQNMNNGNLVITVETSK
nr:hypothetical protein [Paenibacillus alba]